VFGSPEEVRIAFDSRELEEQRGLRSDRGEPVSDTVGRSHLVGRAPPGLPFANANKLMTKKE